MRRTVLLVAAAFALGFACAGADALGYTRFNVWRDLGEKFQLGYVIGYLDGVALAKRGDARVALLVVGGRQDYAAWQARVNEFYKDPANQDKALPVAMEAAGMEFREKAIQKNREGSQPKPVSSATNTTHPTPVPETDH